MSVVPGSLRIVRSISVSALLVAGYLAAAGMSSLWAEELDPGVNVSGVIDYPTALDQVTPNIARGSIALVDLSTPDLRPVSLDLGHQFGNLQVLADLYWNTEPEKQFDYGEIKAKLRILSLDPQRTYIALGAIGRWTDQHSKEAEHIDNKPYSLLGVLTTELFPFDQWGAFLLNLYIDNRFFDAGLKVQLYENIKFVSEVDYHLGDVNNDSNEWRTKAGLEFTSEQNFFTQLLYDDAEKHARLQMGWGF